MQLPAQRLDSAQEVLHKVSRGDVVHAVCPVVNRCKTNDGAIQVEILVSRRVSELRLYADGAVLPLLNLRIDGGVVPELALLRNDKLIEK